CILFPLCLYKELLLSITLNHSAMSGEQWLVHNGSCHCDECCDCNHSDNDPTRLSSFPLTLQFDLSVSASCQPDGASDSGSLILWPVLHNVCSQVDADDSGDGLSNRDSAGERTSDPLPKPEIRSPDQLDSLSQRLKRLKQSWCRPEATEPGAGPEEFKRECTMDQATAETPALIGQVREATAKPDNHSQQPTACGGSSAAVLTPSRRVQAHGRDSSRRKASGKTGLAKLVRQLERTAGRVQQKQG
ncbi:hypothetical protein BOX15_Mlig003162g2, partial [Macrostomum lignano]